MDSNHSQSRVRSIRLGIVCYHCAIPEYLLMTVAFFRSGTNGPTTLPTTRATWSLNCWNGTWDSSWTISPLLSNVLLVVRSTWSGCITQVYLILSLTGPGITFCNITVSLRLPSSVTTTPNWKSSATHTRAYHRVRIKCPCTHKVLAQAMFTAADNQVLYS